MICFTNCYLALEDGSLVERDLWVDDNRGVILNAQDTFYASHKRPTEIIDLGGNILSPGFLDIQINGAYGFDFSIHEDDESYMKGLKMISERIVETGVTSLLPTIITQERSLYPKLLSLLTTHEFPTGATLLGWHAEGPFLQTAKRGAHAQPFLITAPNGISSLDEVYGLENLSSSSATLVRVITAAPEIQGVMESIGPLTKRGVIYSIGHSIATSQIAAEAVLSGAKLITHLFNAMPQLHHRDPAIIGLLGAGGPYSTRPVPGGPSDAADSHVMSSPPRTKRQSISSPHEKSNESNEKETSLGGAEALEELMTPPLTPILGPVGGSTKLRKGGKGMILAERDEFERPFYGLIVDGVHSHPNSVRLAYTAHPEGCILVTDAMSFLDPHLPDGPHDWRDNRRVRKIGSRLYIDGTDTLAGSVITLDACVRNFALFTSCDIGKAIVCVTINPARCLGIEDRKGTLRAGSDADLVVLERGTGRVLSTWVAGKKVFGSV